MTKVLFIWFLLILAEIVRNWDIIEEKDKRPIYFESSVLRLAVGFVFWMGSPFIWHGMTYWQWWGMIPMMLFSFWFLFDYGLNIARGKKPFWYLNPEGSFLDRLQCKYPNAYPWFWWKLFLMTGGFSLFHYGLDAIWTGV